MYISKKQNANGNHGNPQSNKFPSSVRLSDALLSDYLAYNGFVNLTTADDTVTAVEPNTEAWEAWKASLPPETEPEPTEVEKLQAEVARLKAQNELQAQQQSFLEDCLLEMGNIVYA